MKAFLLMVWVLAAAGGVRPNMPPAVTVDSAEPLSLQLVSTLTNALETSQTFLELKHRAKRLIVFIDQQKNGWVRVDVGELSKDFFHRWATLKVETKTGGILKLGTDGKFEDKWFVEFQPPQ